MPIGASVYITLGNLTSDLALQIDKDNSRCRVSSRSPTVTVRVADVEVRTLYNTRAEVNIIVEVVAKRCGLAINSFDYKL